MMYRVKMALVDVAILLAVAYMAFSAWRLVAAI